ncbi:methionine gamma-lyase, partial [mine drainage metagenome]
MHAKDGSAEPSAASRVQDFQVFGEFGEVNPSISDGSTFTFLDPEKLKTIFHQPIPGCHLYSRLESPSTHVLAQALACLEGTPAAHATASGMAAIATTLFALCEQGSVIVSDRLVYGGTHALLR